MKKVFRVAIICKFILITTHIANAYEAGPFTLEAMYIGDVIGNLHGGIKTGAAYMGKADIAVSFHTDRAKWWKGGILKVKLENTHGGTPSADLVGDFQVFNNIEAGNHTYLSELWYAQQIKRVRLQLGLIDMNSDFMVTDHAGIFMNSSFGVPSTISTNNPIPIFPLTGLGFTIQYAVTDGLQLAGGVFDGTQKDWDENPYNVNWSFSKYDGIFSIFEVQSTYSIFKSLESNIKLGAYNWWHVDQLSNADNYNYGLYLSLEQEVFHTSSDACMHVFSQLSWTPAAYNYNDVYFSLGAHATGFWKKRPADEAAIAMCMAYFSSDKEAETNLEVSYKFSFLNHIYMQPHFQCIFNPKGTETHLDTAILLGLRFGLNF